MPYFKWVGVDIVGDMYNGRMAAYSSDDLSERLLNRGIAVLRCRQTYTLSVFGTISIQAKAQVFSSLARLLHAGLMVPDVFITVAQQLNNPILYDALFDWAADLKQGHPFVSVVKKQKKLCDPVVMTMLVVGHESGDLIKSIENAAYYYQMKYEFQKGVRSCLAMPVMTFVFFIGIALFIFVVIMPRFATLFLSMNSELPLITQYMITISSFVLSWSMVYCLLLGILCVTGVYVCNKKIGTKIWNAFYMRIPFVATQIKHHELGQFLQALSLLVNSNVPLSQSLDILRESTNNHVIKHYISCLYADVQSGRLLSHAMSMVFMFSSDIIALIAIGEESGTLGASLTSAADLYKEAVQRSLTRLLFIMQPLVIIILGVLIGMLIFAVYMPIMNLSYVI